MSRLIVKNLPKKIEADFLRQHFSRKGIVTDVQLKFTKDGKFRQFAFVGFETEEEAKNAIKFFNNTFIKTSRIVVEPCAELGTEDRPKAWSKYAPAEQKESKNSEPLKTKKKAKKRDTTVDLLKEDPLFKEFLESHEKEKPLWSNDISLEQQATQPSSKETESDHSEEKEEEEEKVANAPISDLDYMKGLIKKTKLEKSEATKKSFVELFTVKLKNLPKGTKRQDILKLFKPLKPHSVRVPGLKKRFAYAGFKTKSDLSKALLKNKSFYNGKQIIVIDFTEHNKMPEDRESAKVDTKATKWEKQTNELAGEESICDSGRLFFRNLAYSVGEDDLQALFEKYGPIAEINVPIDPLTRKIKGFGTVTFVFPEHAVTAYTELNGTMFHGRMFHLLPGKSQNEDENEEQSSSTFKDKKQKLLKKTAGSAHNWNTLFLGPNVVADILSKNYDTKKEEVLGSSASGTSAAVRLAMGETQIVMDMRKFLEENGVYLSAFDAEPKKRSKTILLAKNLPAETSAKEIYDMFAKFGVLGRILLPPAGVTAIVEFADPSEAKNAFKKLAYKMFKNMPLYLEWAPENTFSTTMSKVEEKETIQKELPKQKLTEETSKDDNDYDEPPEANTTIFIKNLNFSTKEDAIRNHFHKLGPIHTIQIATKKDPQNPKGRISLGYGFIQFKTKSSTEKALKTMQFTDLDGKKIELKRSDRTLSNEVQTNRRVSKATKQTGTKILIRNIPFQAKDSEVRNLFSVFGEIRALRLPRKINAETHRGFGFVDFFTKEDAKKAFEALSTSVHLYGRRLVLEWASDDNDTDELRKRTANHFSGSQSKKRKRAVFDANEIGQAEMAEDDE